MTTMTSFHAAQRLCSSLHQFLIYSTFVLVLICAEWDA